MAPVPSSPVSTISNIPSDLLSDISEWSLSMEDYNEHDILSSSGGGSRSCGSRLRSYFRRAPIQQLSVMNMLSLRHQAEADTKLRDSRGKLHRRVLREYLLESQSKLQLTKKYSGYGRYIEEPTTVRPHDVGLLSASSRILLLLSSSVFKIF